MAFTAGGRFLRATPAYPLPRQGVRWRCPQRAILAGGHLVSSLWGLKTRAVPAGVAAFRSNHSSKIPKNECLRNLFIKLTDFDSTSSVMTLIQINPKVDSIYIDHKYYPLKHFSMKFYY